MKNRLKVLLLFDSPFFAPGDYTFEEEFLSEDWKTEKDVYSALLANNYDVRRLGLHNNITILTDEIKENRPDVVFNLVEVFNNKTRLDKNVAWLVELLEMPYTGASPSSFHICNNKALTKKILSYHKIKVPKFHTFCRHRKIRLPKRLKAPLIVKPLVEEASRGISQASIVESEPALIDRVTFIHEKMRMDAIVEKYIEGRELYVGTLGNRRIEVFPPTEMKFGNELENELRIATYKAKWDEKYRKRWGIKNTFAGKLPDGVRERIEKICKRSYRALDLRSYARFDIRLTPDGDIYILEVNVNPQLACDEDFGLAAEKGGISYDKLIKKITSLAFQR